MAEPTKRDTMQEINTGTACVSANPLIGDPIKRLDRARRMFDSAERYYDEVVDAAALARSRQSEAVDELVRAQRVRVQAEIQLQTARYQLELAAVAVKDDVESRLSRAPGALVGPETPGG